MTRGPIASRLLACLLALVGLQPASAAVAGEVPESARSRSLGITPLLLDGEALVYRLPQLAPRYPGQLMALGLFGNFSANSSGLGVLAGVGANSFFLFNQTADFITAANGLRFMQAGWARSLGRTRIGLAVRGTRIDDAVTVASSPARAAGSTRGHAIDVALGFGLGHGGRFLDVVGELRNLEGQQDYGVSSNAGAARGRALISMESGWFPAIALRAGMRLGSGVQLTAAGSWSVEDVASSKELWISGLPVFIDDRPERDRHWLAGLAGTAAMRHPGDITLFGHYQRDDSAEFLLESDHLAIRRTQIDLGTVGIALESRLWRRLELLAGLRGEYRRQLRDDQRLWVSSTTEIELLASSNETETWSDRFSWGLGYRHRRFELVGSVDARLSLENLILSLDARFFF
jgi:hypothetical protein